MSKQLALSACLSVAAMAAVALFAPAQGTPGAMHAQNEMGTAVEAAAPNARLGAEQTTPALLDIAS